MNEARQLSPQLPREPTVTHDDFGALGLPPLPPPSAERMAVSAHAPSHLSAEIPPSRAMQRLDRASHKALIFFMVALVAFVSGIGVATAVVTGALDLETAWVKELVAVLKQAAKFVLNK